MTKNVTNKQVLFLPFVALKMHHV